MVGDRLTAIHYRRYVGAVTPLSPCLIVSFNFDTSWRKLAGVRQAEAVLAVLVAVCVGGMGGGGVANGRRINFNVTVAISQDYNITQTFQADEEGLAKEGLTPDAQLFGRIGADGKVGGCQLRSLLVLPTIYNSMTNIFGIESFYTTYSLHSVLYDPKGRSVRCITISHQ